MTPATGITIIAGIGGPGTNIILQASYKREQQVVEDSHGF